MSSRPTSRGRAIGAPTARSSRSGHRAFSTEPTRSLRPVGPYSSLGSRPDSVAHITSVYDPFSADWVSAQLLGLHRWRPYQVSPLPSIELSEVSRNRPYRAEDTPIPLIAIASANQSMSATEPMRMVSSASRRRWRAPLNSTGVPSTDTPTPSNTRMSSVESGACKSANRPRPSVWDSCLRESGHHHARGRSVG